MNIIAEENLLKDTLKDIDEKIYKLNDKKIIAFIEFLRVSNEININEHYLDWETILIVVPNRHISNEIKKYKYSINRISFVTNLNAKEIHLFDFNEWKNSTRNKTQFQIRELLKTKFGGTKNINNDSE